MNRWQVQKFWTAESLLMTRASFPPKYQDECIPSFIALSYTLSFSSCLLKVYRSVDDQMCLFVLAIQDPKTEISSDVKTVLKLNVKKANKNIEHQYILNVLYYYYYYYSEYKSF